MTASEIQHDKEAGRIGEMFAAIADRYDLNNRLHSLWMDRRWRSTAVALGRVRPGQSVLDAACGTGELAELLLRRRPGRLVGLDLCLRMLELARRKLPADSAEWVLGDATAMPLPDGSFDRAFIGFGLRNLPDVAAGLAELRRVLRPGGRLVVLEFAGGGVEGSWPGGRLLRLYVERLMPRTAAAIARDRVGAYAYLQRSIREFLSPAALAEAIRRAGFVEVAVRPLTFGIAAVHVGRGP